MRAILFKAKQCGSGLWLFGNVAGYVINDDAEVCFLNETMDNGKIITRYCDPKTVCQYTGQLTSKSEKIFEGDWITGIHNTKGYKFFVQYVEDQFMCCEYAGVEWTDVIGLYDFVSQAGFIEIVGNVHDAAKEGGE